MPYNVMGKIVMGRNHTKWGLEVDEAGVVAEVMDNYNYESWTPKQEVEE